MNGKEPKDKKNREILGLTTTEEIEVCPQCGIVHSRICRPSFEKRLENIPDGDKILKLYHYMKERLS